MHIHVSIYTYTKNAYCKEHFKDAYLLSGEPNQAQPANAPVFPLLLLEFVLRGPHGAYLFDRDVTHSMGAHDSLDMTH